MNKKLFCVVVFLILVLFLSGCGGYPTIPGTSTDVAEIKSVIYEYFSAINKQNWSKAKGYCVYGSDRYYKTGMIQDAVNTLDQQFYSPVTITCVINVSTVNITGNYATAKGSGSIVICAGYYCESESGSGTYYLQKVGGSWKIYGP
jgi:predicted membrane-bound dolichyl-phosphate-mannose-protein mannosyltransferase